MRHTIIFAIVFSVILATSAYAEKIQIGAYSGKPGYFAKVGNEFQLTLDVIVMNERVAQKISKLKFEKLDDVKTCDVTGLQQPVGYTIFKIKSCK